MTVGVEPIRVSAEEPIGRALLVEYIKSWPDKLVTFVAGRLADDDMQEFARELYGACCWPDRDGPDIREWGKT